VIHRLLVPALLLVAACSGDRGGGDISRERFVAANVALRTLPSSATEAERQAVLERYGVDADDLRRWVDRHADRPERIAEAWREISTKLDSLSELRPEPEPGVEHDPFTEDEVREAGAERQGEWLEIQ
jgi:hypothetical protein